MGGVTREHQLFDVAGGPWFGVRRVVLDATGGRDSWGLAARRVACWLQVTSVCVIARPRGVRAIASRACLGCEHTEFARVLSRASPFPPPHTIPRFSPFAPRPAPAQCRVYALCLSPFPAPAQCRVCALSPSPFPRSCTMPRTHTPARTALCPSTARNSRTESPPLPSPRALDIRQSTPWARSRR